MSFDNIFMIDSRNSEETELYYNDNTNDSSAFNESKIEEEWNEIIENANKLTKIIDKDDSTILGGVKDLITGIASKNKGKNISEIKNNNIFMISEEEEESLGNNPFLSSAFSTFESKELLNIKI